METWDEGHLLREGARVVILGRPNAGKSTLLNALLGFERAIVSDVPGTTRDSIEEQVVLGGIPLRIIDTAGLRETACAIEAEGIRRAERHGADAHLALYILDASEPLQEEDRKRISGLERDRSLLVLNKADLGCRIADGDLPDLPRVKLSLLEASGVEQLKRAMVQLLEHGADWAAPPHSVISERHRRLLVKAREEMVDAAGLMQGRMEENAAFAAEHLRAALEFIGQATGRVYHEELMENIFSRFCIGK
jgi:tRNA modification GTPase